ncbi:hypothetical protein [Pelosinus sp. UFO1]|uniref:hypothetical protein n=1 Tax=Pelosinus sp. UFO1 TaxID=484770 RepID=UPI0004D19A04|nr:hypothetical protein [Pelosinus sp. UFO1]AIF52016.1 hypothetical protein UFO1_2469 [Pelosinus sp. UFO1]
MKIGERVTTKYGSGTIKAMEGPYGTQSNPWYRYGVLHDIFPLSVPRMFKNDIMYFNKKELRAAN